MALFGKKKIESKEMPLQSTEPQRRDTTYFGKTLQIKGRVTGAGNLTILGSFEGEFDLKGKLKVADAAKIKGKIKANAVSVNGNVQGGITAQEGVQIDKTAKIEGHITTPKLSIMEGATFDGEVTMSDRSKKPEVSAASDAVASSSITSSATKKLA